MLLDCQNYQIKILSSHLADSGTPLLQWVFRVYSRKQWHRVFSASVHLHSAGHLEGGIRGTGQEDVREGIRTRTGQVYIQCMSPNQGGPVWRLRCHVAIAETNILMSDWSSECESLSSSNWFILNYWSRSIWLERHSRLGDRYRLFSRLIRAPLPIRAVDVLEICRPDFSICTKTLGYQITIKLYFNYIIVKLNSRQSS